ncbi:matrixin family metalloprotease [Porifericola rhodea]|uniref:matrixin family metalloprotease n=1 Tax=Porifericola rhodea TaxID=930972 RepID=UPI0026658A3F|nr:matrixin family metalloprotease [Porifericola rhodea]WKN29767.1 matrixin family metalloprotease [Porifericola rhodea]
MAKLKGKIFHKVVFTCMLIIGFHLIYAQEYRVSIIPVGEVKQMHLEIVKSAIEEFYKVEAYIEKPIEIKNEFITKFDTILDANPINQYIIDQFDTTNVKFIGVTDWCLIIGNRMVMPIRGYAIDLGGSSATLSSYKVLAEVKNEKEHTFEFMFSKVANHELGHLLGLPHCSNEKCLLTFGNNFLQSENKLCQSCMHEIDAEFVKTHQ